MSNVRIPSPDPIELCMLVARGVPRVSIIARRTPIQKAIDALPAILQLERLSCLYQAARTDG